MNWHYVEQGQPSGPVSDEQFAELVRTGKINATTLVWREGMADWLPYQQVALNPTGPGAGPAPTGHPGDTTTEAVCAECLKIFPMDEMIRHGDVRICANCKPVFLQKLAEGAKLETGGMNYAGFWIRVGAKLLDGLILVVPLMVVFVLVMIPLMGATRPGQANFAPVFIQLAMQLGFVAVQISYNIFFVGKYGATPGKMICKLKVVTADGGRIGYGRATGRAFAEMLSGMVCYIGYLLVAFDNPQKRALHDHICNTRVIYK
jgi:uncharacterized RDD family membrane protein YckC